MIDKETLNFIIECVREHGYPYRYAHQAVKNGLPAKDDKNVRRDAKRYEQHLQALDALELIKVQERAKSV